MSDKLYEYMDWPEIEAVVYSEESEPRKILGPRVTEDGILIQSFLPNAVKANVIVTKTKETYEMVMEDEAGYFAVLIPEKEIPKYKIEIEDEEGKKKKRTSLKSILGGDILATDFFRRQTKLLVLIMVFIIFYIHNRYASQQQQIEIDRLKKELIDIKYDALTRSSELMEKSRQSRIEDYISSKESDLQTSTNPPYLIK